MAWRRGYYIWAVYLYMGSDLYLYMGWGGLAAGVGVYPGDEGEDGLWRG